MIPNSSLIVQPNRNKNLESDAVEYSENAD